MLGIVDILFCILKFKFSTKITKIQLKNFCEKFNMSQIESNNGLRKSERTKFPIISELCNKVEAQYEELTELLKQDISEIDNVDDLRFFSIALTEKY